MTIIGASTAALNISTVRGSATVSDNVHAVVDANTIWANLTCAGNGPTSIFGSSTAGGANNCPAE